VAFSACSTLPVEASINNCASACALVASAINSKLAVAMLKNRELEQRVKGRGSSQVAQAEGISNRESSIGGNARLSKLAAGGKAPACLVYDMVTHHGELLIAE